MDHEFLRILVEDCAGDHDQESLDRFYCLLDEHRISEKQDICLVEPDGHIYSFQIGQIPWMSNKSAREDVYVGWM